MSAFQRSRGDVFWGEIAPCEHLVQIYEDVGTFLNALEEFAEGGLDAGEAVLVIATPKHCSALEDRMTAHGCDVAAARSRDQYIDLDAEETLSKFLVNGWPDDELFRHLVVDSLARARRNGRRVRAFGEMVAVLWGRGEAGATVHLEHLWHRLCREEAFPLFCAYPRIGFTQDTSSSIRDICEMHSRVVGT